MLTYSYVARDPISGEKVKAEVQAESEQAAAKLIQKNNLAPISISLKGAGSARNPLNKFKNKVSTKDKILFSRQLSTLINAGLPLVQALNSVAGQTGNKAFKAIIAQVISDIEGGSSFSASIAKRPDVFNQIYISLIQAGEASGTLDTSLERIANQQEKDAEIVSKVRSALVYPGIVLVVMGGVLTFMIVSVLPQVEVLYNGIKGAQLPLLTRVLLVFTKFVINYWWIAILIAVAVIFTLYRLAKSTPGKSALDKFKMNAGPVGKLFMKVYMARFSRTGTTLISSGVPLLQMLEITANSINNVHIEKSIRQAIDKVKGGKSLADSISGDTNFLELVPNMLRIGEQSGSMEQMLSKTADYYEKEVDNEVKTISTIIEPLLMVVLGVVAFIIVAAVLLPIYGLAGKNLGG